ncbi:MAG: alpha/beta hydrolase [Bdellovibrionota bacterium]
MSFRHKGKTSRLKIWIFESAIGLFMWHGLMADEAIWKGFAPKLSKRYSVLHIRYNTGRHISENGKSFCALMNELVRRHSPRKIVLIGHSMGGLVIRSACHYGKLQAVAGSKK